MTWIPCACVCGEVHPHPHAQTSIGPHAAIDPAELWVMGMCVRVASVTPAAATAKNRNTVVMDTPEEAGEEADGMMVSGCVFFGFAHVSRRFPVRSNSG